MLDDQVVRTADVIADALVTAGVHRVYAYPGDPIIEFMDALRIQEIDVVLARREGSAAFMAVAEGMLSEVPGTVLSTLGPGSTALVNGVAAAYLDKVPLIAISGQIDSAREPFFTHQVIDHAALFRPVTKWAGRIDTGSVGTTMRKAIRTATAERPGPVHITVGGDTFVAPTKDHDVTTPPLSVPRGGFAVAGADPVAVLHAARRPVLLVGTAAARAGASESVARFAQTVGAPIVVAPMAKGVVAETNEYFAGVLDMACNQLIWGHLQEADLIISAGFDPVELIKPWTVTVPVLHIDTVPNTDQIYASGSEVVGDIGAALDALTDSWTRGPARDPDDVASFRRTLRRSYYSGRSDSDMNPTDVVDAVRDAFPADAIATCDVGSHKLLVGQGWTAHSPRSVLITNGLSAMGFGVPAGIAAALYHPDRPVVSMVGDGGFAMAATELRLASALGLGLTVVVFVDGSLNRIEIKQMAKGLPSVATRIEDTDLVKLAESMGCEGVRVRTQAGLDRALESAIGRTVPLVVEAHVNPQQYTAQY